MICLYSACSVLGGAQELKAMLPHQLLDISSRAFFRYCFPSLACMLEDRFLSCVSNSSFMHLNVLSPGAALHQE